MVFLFAHDPLAKYVVVLAKVYQKCLEEGTLTCVQTSVLANNQGEHHGNTTSFGVAAEMKLHEY
jgi:hypothetical protein